MRERFIPPEVQVILFDYQDLIRTSPLEWFDEFDFGDDEEWFDDDFPDDGD